MKLRCFLITITAFLSVTIVKGQGTDLYNKNTFTSKAGTMPYRILFPENFDPEKKYPLILFLHGRGESGNDNQKQLTHGAAFFLQDSIRIRYPAIVVFPQCPAESYWANVKISTDSSGKRIFNFVKGEKPSRAMKMLLGLTEQLLDQPFVDDDRVYIGGLSMGGMGTFEILRREKKIFAAGFVICGGDNVSNVRKYRKVPLWIFHGAKDDVVPPESSALVATELKNLGSSVRYTLYPNAKHNSWDLAFAEPELLKWLFSYRKKN